MVFLHENGLVNHLTPKNGFHPILYTPKRKLQNPNQFSTANQKSTINGLMVWSELLPFMHCVIIMMVIPFKSHVESPFSPITFKFRVFTIYHSSHTSLINFNKLLKAHALLQWFWVWGCFLSSNMSGLNGRKFTWMEKILPHCAYMMQRPFWL